MPTLNNELIRNTTTTITDTSVEYSNRKGFSRSYSILGLIVRVDTTKERGWNRYETKLTLSVMDRTIENEITTWYENYKQSLGVKFTWNPLTTYSESVERHTQTRYEQAHTLALLASENFVLQILNKYIEILFTNVNDEVITRQIAELQTQLSTSLNN